MSRTSDLELVQSKLGHLEGTTAHTRCAWGHHTAARTDHPDRQVAHRLDTDCISGRLGQSLSIQETLGRGAAVGVAFAERPRHFRRGCRAMRESKAMTRKTQASSRLGSKIRVLPPPPLLLLLLLLIPVRGAGAEVINKVQRAQAPFHWFTAAEAAAALEGNTVVFSPPHYSACVLPRPEGASALPTDRFAKIWNVKSEFNYELGTYTSYRYVPTYDHK